MSTQSEPSHDANCLSCHQQPDLVIPKEPRVATEIAEADGRLVYVTAVGKIPVDRTETLANLFAASLARDVKR